MSPSRVHILFQTRNMTSSVSIGFIGLGKMGLPMSRRLLRKAMEKGAASSFSIFDTNQSVYTSLKSISSEIKTCESPAELAHRSNVIFSMLPTGQDVRQAYLGTNGVLEGMRKHTVCVDSSTIDLHTTTEVARQVDEKGGVMVDAPVSGGVLGADAGTLTFMVGSTDSAFECVEPFLSIMGKHMVHCGPNGHGQIAKICNNMLLGTSMIAVSETMNLGIKLGMDAKLLAKILNMSSGRCWSSDTYNPVPNVVDNVPSSQDYEGGFSTMLMRKDMGLAADAAKDVGASIPLAAISGEMYQSLCNDEIFKNKDFSVVYKWLSGGQKTRS